jgi:hypothetical protein
MSDRDTHEKEIHLGEMFAALAWDLGALWKTRRVYKLALAGGLCIDGVL